MKASFRITGMTICASNLKLCGLLLYFFEAEYKATVSCVGGGIGEDTSLDPLWEVAQRLTLSLEFHDTEFRLSGEHFYNDLSKNQHLNIWLADVSLIHKVGKWRFAASAINLFNKEQYRYTLLFCRAELYFLDKTSSP